VAPVTGGAVRVGRAIALALAREGSDVAVGYHASAAAARATLADLEALGVRAVALRADLARPAAARAGRRRRAPAGAARRPRQQRRRLLPDSAREHYSRPVRPITGQALFVDGGMLAV
jgi:hypothetical protein